MSVPLSRTFYNSFDIRSFVDTRNLAYPAFYITRERVLNYLLLNSIGKRIGCSYIVDILMYKGYGQSDEQMRALIIQGIL